MGVFMKTLFGSTLCAVILSFVPSVTASANGLSKREPQIESGCANRINGGKCSISCKKEIVSRKRRTATGFTLGRDASYIQCNVRIQTQFGPLLVASATRSALDLDDGGYYLTDVKMSAARLALNCGCDRY